MIITHVDCSASGNAEPTTSCVEYTVGSVVEARAMAYDSLSLRAITACSNKDNDNSDANAKTSSCILSYVLLGVFFLLHWKTSLSVLGDILRICHLVLRVLLLLSCVLLFIYLFSN